MVCHQGGLFCEDGFSSQRSFILGIIAYLFLCVRVIATDIEDKKLELAKQMGADITVNTMHQDLKEVGVPADITVYTLTSSTPSIKISKR